MKKLFLFIPIIIFISSCTITKRVHRPGFYISSHRNIKVTKAKEEAKTYIVEEKVDTTATTVSNNKAEKKEVVGITESKSYQEEKVKTKVVKAPVLKEKVKSSKNFIVNKFSKNKPQEIKQPAENEDKKTNILGLLSFIFMIVPVLSIILGALAMRYTKKNPEKYKNKWMAKVGYIVGMIATAFIIISIQGLIIIPILGFASILVSIYLLIKPINNSKIQKIAPYNINEVKTTNILGLLSFIFMIIPVVSVILGALAIKYIKLNPEKYKNTWTAKVGYIVGLIFTAGIGIILIGLYSWSGLIALVTGILFIVSILVSIYILIQAKKIRENS